MFHKSDLHNVLCIVLFFIHHIVFKIIIQLTPKQKKKKKKIAHFIYFILNNSDTGKIKNILSSFKLPKGNDNDNHKLYLDYIG